MATLHRSAALLPALAVALALAGCGNKGALVRPLPEPAEADAPPARALPPATDPAEADPPEEIVPPAADPPADPTTTPAAGGTDGDG